MTVTDSYGCTTSGSVIVKAVTGTSEVNKAVTAHINPNPNNGHFTLTMELPKAQTVSIAVFNLIGQKVAHRTLKGKSISEQIDLGPLSIGTYLVRINTELGVLTRWMVIAQ